MAGHSQFKNIMHRKGAQDKKRAKVFTKIIRELTVAARAGDDPTMNPLLRTAMATARGANMPKDTMERAIKRGAGGEDDTNYATIRYEGYGPAGVAVIVEALTDNKNRTAGEVRAAFSRFGGNLGEAGSVSFQFSHSGVLSFPRTVGDFDAVFEAAIESGAQDVQEYDASYEILCDLTDFHRVSEALTAALGEPEKMGLEWVPTVMTPVTADKAETIMKLIDLLEDSDDVQSVFSNMEVDAATLKALEG